MESKRQKQVAELVKRNFSLVMQEEAVNICGKSVFITVTKVNISPDMGYAKIYLSIFNTDHVQEPLLLLKEELPALKAKLGQRIRHQVRIIPNLALFYDDTIDEMYRVDGMMKKLEEDGQFGDPNKVEEE
jgi:ribosome-binding factor A